MGLSLNGEALRGESNAPGMQTEYCLSYIPSDLSPLPRPARALDSASVVVALGRGWAPFTRHRSSSLTSRTL